MSKPFEDLGLTAQQIGQNYTWTQVKKNSDNIDAINNEIDDLIFSDTVNQQLVAVGSNDIVTAGNNISIYGDNLTVETGSSNSVVVGQNITMSNSIDNIIISPTNGVSTSDVTDSGESVMIGQECQFDYTNASVSVGNRIEFNSSADNSIAIQANINPLNTVFSGSVASIAIGSGNDIFNSDFSVQIGVNSDITDSDRTIQIGHDSDVTESDDSIIIGAGNDQTGGPGTIGNKVVKIGSFLNLDPTGENYTCISQNGFNNAAAQLPAPGSVILGAGEDVSTLPKLQFLSSNMETLKNNVAPATPYVDYNGSTNFFPGNANGWMRLKYQGFPIRIPIYIDTETVNAP